MIHGYHKEYAVMDLRKKKNIDISVIIPLYKGNRFCVHLLNMIEKNCLYKDLYQRCKVEVIFVNDYPDEEIIIEKRSKYFDTCILVQDKNRGIHASRVRGITASSGKYIIMLDQDDLVTEDWLYSQWHKIDSENADYYVCNGWGGRFRVLAGEEDFRNRINDLNYYLARGCAICSPGQAIIRRTGIPHEWMENVQKINGADDFLLWLIILKKGNHFLVNDEYLYYHTPERTVESIDLEGTVRSLGETAQILNDLALLDKDEISLLNRQIIRKGDLGKGKLSRRIEQMDQYDIEQFEKSIKFQNMFRIMDTWMRIKNRGIKISDYFKEKHYYNIAIYGMGYIGECLFDELHESGIQVRYGIDRNAIDFKNELAVYRIEDELIRVDAVIVTIIENGKKVIDFAKNKIDCPVISFLEILLTLSDRMKNGDKNE